VSRQGAKKQGIREHVKVRKKHDSAGVGAVRWLAAPFIFAVASMVVRACRRRLTGRAVQVEAVKQARDWTLGMAAFDRVLAALNQAPAAPAGAGPEAGPDTLGAQPQVAAADDGAGIPAAEPPRKRRKAAPASGAAEGKRQRACAAADACASGAPAEPEPRGKRRKRAGAQGDGAQAALDGATAAAGGAAESAAAPAGAEAGGADATAAGEGRAGGSHLARFTRRRRCKDARSYSGADLAAILGAAPEPGEHADKRALPLDGPRAACTPGASSDGRNRSVGRRLTRGAGRPTAAPLPRAPPPRSPVTQHVRGLRRRGRRAGRGGGGPSPSARAGPGGRLVAPLLRACGPPGQPGAGGGGRRRRPAAGQAEGAPPAELVCTGHGDVQGHLCAGWLLLLHGVVALRQRRRTVRAADQGGGLLGG